MKPFLAFLFGTFFVIVCALGLELWCEAELKKKKPMFVDLRNIQLIGDIKKLYPNGIYPEPPAPLPPERQYKGPRFLATKLDLEVHYLNDPKFHKLSSRQIMKDQQGKIYNDNIYFYDKHFRRVFPANETKKKTSRFVLSFGDSNIVGLGLPGDKTLGNFLSENLPDVKVYEYSSMGIYPYELLEKSGRLNRQEEIPEKDGVALYFYFSYHLRRNMGGLHELKQRERGEKRSVGLDENGEIQIGKAFKNERPIWFTLAPYLSKSSIIRYFDLDLKPGEKDFTIQTVMIKKMRANLASKGITKFYVVIHPFQFSLSETQALLPYLYKENIPFIYMGHWRMSKITEGPTTLVYDIHVSAESNKVIADGLADALKTLL